jgi:hypothetical protein
MAQVLLPPPHTPPNSTVNLAYRIIYWPLDNNIKDVTPLLLNTSRNYTTLQPKYSGVCYNECGGILSADVACTCAWRVGPSHFD